MERARFGMFTFTPSTGELRRGDVPVRLQAQPSRVLAALVARPGQVVSRESLQHEIWGDDTHVDFERGLNFCMAQVRGALGDSAESPRFIETIPKQGYRFIAPVVVLSTDGERHAGPVITASHGGPGLSVPGAPVSSPMRSRRPLLAAVATAALLLAAAALVWARIHREPATVIVVPFYNETGRADLEPVARSLGDAVVASLASPARVGDLSVIGNAPALRNPFARPDVQQIASELGAQWVVIGQLKADERDLRLIAHLIRASDMKHVWAQPFDDASFSFDRQSRAAEAIAAAVETHVRQP